MAGRNNLYCSDIYNELDNWEQMYKSLELEHVEVVNLKLLRDNTLHEAHSKLPQAGSDLPTGQAGTRL